MTLAGFPIGGMAALAILVGRLFRGSAGEVMVDSYGGIIYSSTIIIQECSLRLKSCGRFGAVTSEAT